MHAQDATMQLNESVLALFQPVNASNSSDNGTVSWQYNYSFLNMSMAMFLAGVCGNVLALIILFRTRPGEQCKTVFQVLIKALVLNDVTFIIMTSIPPQLAYAHNMVWQGGAIACQYHASAMLCAGLTTPFLITIMSIERAVCLGWWQLYVQHMTKRRAVLTVIASITFAACFSLLPVVGLGRTTLQTRGSWCFLDLRSPRLLDRVYSFTYASFLTLSITVSLTANLYVIVTLLRYRRLRKEIVRDYSSACVNKNRHVSVPEMQHRMESHNLLSNDERFAQTRSHSLPAVHTPYRPCLGLSLSANCRKHSKSLLRVQLLEERRVHTTSVRQETDASVSASYRLKDLELQMVVLLFVLTVVFTVCWTPLTAQIYLSVFEVQSDRFLLAVRMASFNQLIDPWCYVVLRIGAVVRIFSLLRRSFRNLMQPPLGNYSRHATRRNTAARLVRAILQKLRKENQSESTCDCMCDCPCHLRNAGSA